MAPPPLLSLRDATISFGGKPLFQDLFVALTKGDKTCLVGRNGCGKSTLLKLLGGLIELDRGEYFLQPHVKVAYLPQDVSLPPYQTTLEFVAQNIPEFEAAAMLDVLQVDATRKMENLSGGERRRVALAHTLAKKADVLLLDEPTNHLDLPTIEWLEGELLQHSGALLTISHDRRFLERVSTSSLWLDRGILYRHHKGFKDFDNWTGQILLDEERKMQKLETRLRLETDWLHYGVTARRKRNQGRLKQLHKLREEKQSRLSNQHGKLNVTALANEGESKLVLEAKNLKKAYGDRVLIKDFSIRIQKGDRIGILGPNGAGKSTLLRMLIGQLTPDEGTVRLGPTVETTYLDQMQAELNPQKTLWQTLCDTGGDQVFVQGQHRHVVAYLKDFLFSDKQAKAPVGALSGGERNRLALAKALTTPGNLMVLDEPTNDLDMDTLDLLQEILSEYSGTLLIVSHDRDFLDRLTTSIIAVEGDGSASEYIGGYDDYLRQRSSIRATTSPAKSRSKPETKSTVDKPRSASSSTKLSFKDQYELGQLAKTIPELLEKKAKLEECLTDPTLYTRDPEAFTTLTNDLKVLQDTIDDAETRWLELEIKQGGKT